MMALQNTRSTFFNMFRTTISAGALLVALALPLSAHADTDGASKFIQGLGDKAVSTLSDKSISADAANTTFRNMLHQSFDLDLLGRFALGPSWKEIQPAQKQEYLKLFEQFVVQIYSDRFAMYSGETFKVTSAKAEDEEGRDSYVTSEIIAPGGGHATQVDWRVRNKGGQYKVIDVIVEGVSMSVSQRSEFMAAIQRNGGDFDQFLKILRDRVEKTVPSAK